jgi:predicted MFS family arabinose efflux permease
MDSRVLLWWYYSLRGLSLFVLPSLFASSLHPHMLVFVLFYGLDWVATVPPTVALCRQVYGDQGTLVFGWVFASHQVGAAVAATVAGAIRTSLGTYDLAWYGAGVLCLVAAAFSLSIGRGSPRGGPRPAEAATSPALALGEG